MSSEILRDKIEALIKEYGIKAKRYLDLGCGDGTLTVRIANIIDAEEVYGVDIDEKLLERAKVLGIKTLKFDLESLSYNKLPFRDEYFDFITAVEVIEHLSHSDDLLMEVHRVLRSGGYFLITTPNLASWINRLLILLGYQPRFSEPSKYYWIGLPGGVRRKEIESVYGHKNLYTLRALTQILEVYGFRIIDVRGCESYCKGILKYIDRFLSALPSLASILIVLCQK